MYKLYVLSMNIIILYMYLILDRPHYFFFLFSFSLSTQHLIMMITWTKECLRLPHKRSACQRWHPLLNHESRWGIFLALVSMNSETKCDTWCELYNPTNHRVFASSLWTQVAAEATWLTACLPGCHASLPLTPLPSKETRGGL